MGPSLFFAGQTDAAIRSLEQGLAEGSRFGGTPFRTGGAACPATQ